MGNTFLGRALITLATTVGAAGAMALIVWLAVLTEGWLVIGALGLLIVLGLHNALWGYRGEDRY